MLAVAGDTVPVANRCFSQGDDGAAQAHLVAAGFCWREHLLVIVAIQRFDDVRKVLLADSWRCPSTPFVGTLGDQGEL